MRIPCLYNNTVFIHHIPLCDFRWPRWRSSNTPRARGIACTPNTILPPVPQWLGTTSGAISRWTPPPFTCWCWRRWRPQVRLWCRVVFICAALSNSRWTLRVLCHHAGLRIISNLDEVAFIQNLVFYIEAAYKVAVSTIYDGNGVSGSWAEPCTAIAFALQKASRWHHRGFAHCINWSLRNPPPL